MDLEICDHCGTTNRVKSWINGSRKHSMCWTCAIDLVTMQKEIQEWVG